VIDNTVRGTDAGTASRTCAGLGRRLPAAGLDTSRQSANVTIGSTVSLVGWTSDIKVNVGTGAIAATDVGAYSSPDRRNFYAFRCVVSPRSNRPTETKPREI
jgi:hypothetical protein